MNGLHNMDDKVQKKRFIESSSFYTNKTSENPFSDMKIDDSSFLEEVPSRRPCPVCNKSRKYYCYTCYVAVKEVSCRLPVVNLPVQIDIIKHPKEVDGKSTSAHAAVLAPNSVKIYIYPDFPSYETEKVLLIFPGKSALPFQEWWSSRISEHDSGGNNFIEKENSINVVDNKRSDHQKTLPFSKVIFIDSTWRQAKALYNDERLKKVKPLSYIVLTGAHASCLPAEVMRVTFDAFLPEYVRQKQTVFCIDLSCVVLSSYKSLFWRYYRGKQEAHLSTVEAIYYFLVELDSLMVPNEPYTGRYDNMLFFFKFMYYKIRTLYDPLKLKAYQSCVHVEDVS